MSRLGHFLAEAPKIPATKTSPDTYLLSSGKRSRRAYFPRRVASNQEHDDPSRSHCRRGSDLMVAQAKGLPHHVRHRLGNCVDRSDGGSW